MDRIQNLIGAAQFIMDIDKGNPHVPTPATGTIAAGDTQAPPTIVNLYNDCQRDKARLQDSDALVTLHEIGFGKTDAVRLYWKFADTLRQTLERIEKVLTPLPCLPREIAAIVDDLTPLLKDANHCNEGIVEGLIAIKTEVNALAGTSPKGV